MLSKEHLSQINNSIKNVHQTKVMPSPLLSPFLIHLKHSSQTPTRPRLRDNPRVLETSVSNIGDRRKSSCFILAVFKRFRGETCCDAPGSCEGLKSLHIAQAKVMLKNPIMIVRIPMIRLILASVDRLRV